MSETLSLLEPTFNRSVKVEARDERLSSDAGALLLREALEHSGLLRTLMPRLTDFRDPTRTLHSLDELVRSVLLLQAQGWGDFSDVNALEADPALRVARSRDRGQAAARQALPSQATISRLLDTLARPANRAVLDAAPLQLAARRIRAANRGHRHRQLTLDIDGLPLPVHGEQPGTAYNGHVGARMHYPLIASCAETGDMLAGLLRDGNAGPAAEAAHWVPALVAEAEQHLCQRAVVRMDAGFTDGTTLEALDSRAIGYLGRLRENPVLQRLAQPHLVRGPGRPAEKPREWVVETTYRAGSWSRERRVLMVVQEEPGHYFRRCFFLVTNLDWPPTRVLAHYRKRGKAEGHMGEFKDVIGTSLPPTSRGVADDDTVRARSQALLSLRLLAFELMHILRARLETLTGEGWSLRRLRERVLKVAARVQRTGRRLHFVIARPALPLWRKLMPSLARMAWPPPG